MRAITLRCFRDAIFVNHLNAFIYDVVKMDISMSKQAERDINVTDLLSF